MARTSVDEGGTLNGPSVLGNDSDPDSVSLTAVLETGPAHGSVTLDPDGTFAYTHDGSETTSDSFTYRVSDGSLTSAPVTVSITVTPVNDPPVAVADGPYPVDEGGTLNGPSVLGNDWDPDSVSLTAVLETGPAHGSVSLDPDGTFTYTHDGSETTSDSFTYRVSDGSLTSAPVTVSITVTPVNDPPVGRWPMGPFTWPRAGR
jgi:large repetitive protein